MWRVSYSTLSVLDAGAYLNWTGMGDRDMTAYGYTAVLATDAALSQNDAKVSNRVPAAGPGNAATRHFLQLKARRNWLRPMPARFGAATGTAHNGLSTPSCDWTCRSAGGVAHPEFSADAYCAVEQLRDQWTAATWSYFFNSYWRKLIMGYQSFDA
jgi:hypothetical protein